MKARKDWLKQVRDFFNGVLAEWDFDAENIAILVSTCDCLERFHRCRIQIRDEGQIVTTKTGAVKPHPLLAYEKQAFSNFLAGCRKLNLVEPEPRRPAHRPLKGPG